MSVIIPDGFTQLLQEFTVAVLRTRPPNLIEFAAAHFRRLEQLQQQHGTASKVQFQPAQEQQRGATPNLTPKTKRPEKTRTTRKSVAAPSFDPEQHEATYERRVVPKSDEQRRRLMEAMRHILLFRSLERADLGHVIDAMEERLVSAGTCVIEQDQEGDNFYVVEKGIFEAFVRDRATGTSRHVLTYKNEGSFGELALMYYCPRAATIVAKTDGVLWSLDMETFQQKVLMAAFKHRKNLSSGRAAAGREMTQYERQNVADALREREFSDGEPIILQGDVGNEMFFIEDGSVRVMRRHNAADSGLETQSPAATPWAPRAVCVLHVSDFERLLGPCLTVMRRNIDAYKRQLAEIFGGDEASVPLPRADWQRTGLSINLQRVAGLTLSSVLIETAGPYTRISQPPDEAMNIDVIGRVRPSIRNEGPCTLAIGSDNRVSSRPGGQSFVFQHLYQQGSSNLDVYSRHVEPMVDIFLAGYNVCFMCFGESGSGKSFTLAGDSSMKNGLVPLVLASLFCQAGP
uniref:cAMP-dependent protein kinase type II regulatory subunit n=1 Tax=Macrostomum lignano TaxID=282301 RepID=A0A1I8FF44_9PLAT